jgi:hypothetical protein
MKLYEPELQQLMKGVQMRSFDGTIAVVRVCVSSDIAGLSCHFFSRCVYFYNLILMLRFFFYADTPQTKLNHGQGSVHCKSGCSECRIMREDGNVPCIPVDDPFSVHALKDETFVRKCAMRWRRLAARGATKKERADHVSKYGQRDSPMLSVAGYSHGIRQILETMHMFVFSFFPFIYFWFISI